MPRRANWQETITRSVDQSVRMTTAEIVRPDCVGSSKMTFGFGSSGTSTTLRNRISWWLIGYPLWLSTGDFMLGTRSRTSTRIVLSSHAKGLRREGYLLAALMFRFSADVTITPPAHKVEQFAETRPPSHTTRPLD